MLRLGAYLFQQKRAGRERFPLLVQLEPLFQCNLACAGCGKIQHPPEILRRRMSVEEAVGQIVECGAPMVSIAGGEPLIHPEIHVIVAELIERKKFVYLCTNGLLLRERIGRFESSTYFSWVLHIDGLGESHDRAVSREGVFAECVAAIAEAKRRGFRVATNSTFFDTDTPGSVRGLLDFLNDELDVDQMMISPGYAYQSARDQENFIGVQKSRDLFRKAFSDGRRQRWRLNHSPLFLDFLEGQLELDCTAWAIPSFSVLGWQRPCYLVADGYARSYRELVETTDWEKYGRGRDERCANCTAHCGYEPTAVLETSRSLRQSLRALRAAF